MRLPHDLTLTELRDLADVAVLIAAAADAGIFTELASGGAPSPPLGGVGEGGPPAADGASRLSGLTAEELAHRTGYDLRAVRIVLQALAEAGVLSEEGRRFTPTPRCREELCEPDGPGYVARGLPLWLRSIRAWTRLGEVLERGGPLEPRAERRSPDEVARFMAGMAAAPAERIRRLVELCLVRHPGARTMLDVGGGPGHMTRAFAERGVAATLYDTEEIIQYVVDAYGLDEVSGLTTAVGDFRTDPLPEGPFDIVLISNVLHIYPPDTNRALLARAAEVVPSGGMIAIGEFLRGRSRKAARFGVQMLVKSDGGDAYTEEEITEWLTDAGFSDAEVADLDPDRQLLTAVRR